MAQKVISKELLDILVCPECKADLKEVEHPAGAVGLQCVACKRIYPVRDGIPIMLVEEAIRGE